MFLAFRFCTNVREIFRRIGRNYFAAVADSDLSMKPKFDRPKREVSDHRKISSPILKAGFYVRRSFANHRKVFPIADHPTAKFLVDPIYTSPKILTIDEHTTRIKVALLPSRPQNRASMGEAVRFPSPVWHDNTETIQQPTKVLGCLVPDEQIGINFLKKTPSKRQTSWQEVYKKLTRRFIHLEITFMINQASKISSLDLASTTASSSCRMISNLEPVKPGISFLIAGKPRLRISAYLIFSIRISQFNRTVIGTESNKAKKSSELKIYDGI
uniref:Uncharacterized protein n=1 Tax=Romanomermis culicivorax TaxID=13658 RepID=A0A915KLD5_ROMCU